MGTSRNLMEKLINYYLHVQYHKKYLLRKKKSFLGNHKTIYFFFLRMIAFKTHLEIEKFKWIGKMIYNIIK